MVITWSEFAKNNLKDFISNTKMEHKNAINYIITLVKYTENLYAHNYLGKCLLIINELEIRQLIYKNHRILYYILDNEIIIITVIHTMQDLKTTISNIKQLLSQ